jgi:hypothetical protein
VRLGLALLGLHLGLFALLRAAFWLAFRAAESSASGQDVAHALSLGVRFDLRLATLLVLPFFALAWIRGLDPLARQAARSGWLAYFTAAMAITSLIYVADCAHYAWVDRRIDVSVLEYALPLGTALQVVWQTYPVVPLATGIALGLLLWNRALSRCMRWAARREAKRPAERTAPFGALGRARNALAGVALAALLATGVIGRISGYPLRWSHAFFSPDPFTSALGLNPVLYLIDTWPYAGLEGSVDPEAARRAYRRLSGYFGIREPRDSIDLRREVAPEQPLASSPNVVVILLESFGANKVGILGNPLDPTPNFDRIARDSLLFTNFYTASRGTARAVFSLLTGIPDVTRRGSRNPLVADQHILVNDFPGYEKLYFYTGDLAWGNIRGLLQNNIAGLRVFEEKDYRSPHNDGWGISDLHLFEEANARLRELGERPFIAFLHTSGNHRPYTIPADSKGFERRPTDPQRLFDHAFRSQEEFDSLRFMDHSLGHFFELARRERYFERTLFVILGDHGSKGSGSQPWQKIGLTAIHIPLVIHAPRLLEPRVIDTPGSSLDVLPTLAALVAFPHVNTALGRNLLEPRADGESFVFSEGGLVDGDLFLADGRLYRFRSSAPERDLAAELPAEFARMSGLWNDFRTLAAYLMQHNAKQQVYLTSR